METLDGTTLELRGALSLRELTVDLADLEGNTWELDLTRDQVVQLRDALDAWLERGQPS